MQSEFNNFLDLSRYSPRRSWNMDVLPNPIQEVVLEYGDAELNKLSNSNGYYRSQKTRIRRVTRPRLKRLTLASVQLKNKTRALTDHDIRILVDLQIDSNRLDLITVPDPNYTSPNLEPLKRALDTAHTRVKQLREDHGRVVPFLDLYTEPPYLRERLEYLSRIYPMIGIRYRRARPSRLVVRDVMQDKEVLVHASGVQKHYSNDMRVIPELHILPVDFFDSVCAFKKRGFPTKTRRIEPGEVFEESKPRKIDKDAWRLRATVKARKDPADSAYYFDPTPLGYYTISDHKKEFGGMIGCSCPICQGKTRIEDFIDEYYYHKGSQNISKLKSHLAVHELFASFEEFTRSQTEIRKSSYVEYLQSKFAIAQNLENIVELQPTLDQFLSSSP